MSNRCEQVLMAAAAALMLASCASLVPPPAPGVAPPAISNTRLCPPLHAPAPVTRTPAQPAAAEEYQASEPGPAQSMTRAAIEPAVPAGPVETPAPLAETPAEDGTDQQAAALVRDAAAFAALTPAQQHSRLAAAGRDYRKQGGPDALLRLALYTAVADPATDPDADLRGELAAYIDRNRGAGGATVLLPLAQLAAALLAQHEDLVTANTGLRKKLEELKAIEERLSGGRDKRESIRIVP